MIVGAGPYGLAAAAHLRGIRGLSVAVHGEPMSFWQRQMPRGMLLRSPWDASHIGSPARTHTLDAFESERGEPLRRPIPLEDFVAYGDWFQRRFAPDVDRRRVRRVDSRNGGFCLRLEDGASIETARVVVAAGIAPFALRPTEFAGLPRAVVSHASDHEDLGRFAGADVAVIGAGQSAIESAALLAEAGARVEVIMRVAEVNWLVRSSWLHRGPLRPLFYAPSDVGPAGVSWLIALPNAFRRIPRKVQDPLARRSIRAAASEWLVPRTREVTFTAGSSVRSARVNGSGLELSLSDGTKRRVDHALLGTGYRVDIAAYDFLPPELLARVHRVDGYPKLSSGFECSLPGLHFLGAPAAWSFGPLTRFVAGSDFAAAALTRSVRGGRGASVRTRDVVRPVPVRGEQP